MKSVIPVRGEKLKELGKKMALWSLKILGDEIKREPSRVISKLKSFWKFRNVSNIYMDGLKPIQFGDCLEDGVKIGLYTPNWPSRALESRLRRTINGEKFPPEQVILSVTDECHYRCPHCFNAREPRQEMPVSRLEEAVKEIQAVGGSFLNISGGEPLIKIDRVLSALKSADNSSEIWLDTTGFGLDEEKARKLKEAGLFGVHVSIHHYKPEKHDQFVGYVGAFKIATESIDCFKRAGLFPVMTTAIPINKINPQEIYNIMSLGKDLGAGIVELLPIMPAGRAVIECTHGKIDDKLSRQIEETCLSYNKDDMFYDFPSLNTPPYFETPNKFGCVAGNGRLFISASGDVQPCSLLNLSFGNLMEENLKTIVNRMRSLMPHPRKDLLCTQVSPMVLEYLSRHEQQSIKLPIPLEQSLKIFSQLPAPEIPDAYA